MKELWLHLGLPKNGSSAIQVFLAKNIENLKKEGINYIELSDITDAKKGAITSGNGALLARSLLPEKHEAYYFDNGKLYQDLMRWLETTKENKILLSSEFFAIVPLDKVEKLKKDLLNIGVILKVVFYVRRQDQFLMSSYMQRVKRHGYIGYPEDFVLNEYKKIHFLNYFSYTKQFVDLLGRENVFPGIYEITKEHKKGLIGDFIETILGYLPNWVEPVQSINTSPSPLELKFMLISNQYKPRMKFSDFLIEDSIIRGKSQKYQDHNILSNEIINEILNYFADENNKFSKKFMNGQSFPPFSQEGKYIDLKNIQFSINEVLDIITGFLVRYDRRLIRLENSFNEFKKEK